MTSKHQENHNVLSGSYSREVALELERASLDRFTNGCLEGMACCARDGDEVSYLTFATQDKSPDEALVLQAIFVDEYRKPESAIHPGSLGFFVSRIRVLDPDFYGRLIEPALLGICRLVDRLEALAPDLLLDTFAREGSRLFKLLNKKEEFHA